jgi:hypothetical protein
MNRIGVGVALIFGLFLLPQLSTSALARFLQADPVGYKDDLDMYNYVGNNPTNKTDPTGRWACDTTCTPGEKSQFTQTQQDAKTALHGKITVLKSLSTKLKNGGTLSPTEKLAASLMNKFLGNGAGSNASAVDSLIGIATGIANDLDSNKPMSVGPMTVKGDIAEWHEGGDTLSKGFFSQGSAGRQEALVHETNRETLSRMSPGSLVDEAALPGGKWVYAYGAKATAELAGSGSYAPDDAMRSFPDAVPLALGFHRDGE